MENKVISKELLSEVLGYEVLKIGKVVEGTLGYSYNSSIGYINTRIDIYELEHKCKQWLINEKGLSYICWYDDSFKNYKCEIIEENNNDGIEGEYNKFVAETENKAVIGACQYRLDLKDNK